MELCWLELVLLWIGRCDTKNERNYRRPLAIFQTRCWICAGHRSIFVDNRGCEKFKRTKFQNWEEFHRSYFIPVCIWEVDGKNIISEIYFWSKIEHENLRENCSSSNVLVPFQMKVKGDGMSFGRKDTSWYCHADIEKHKQTNKQTRNRTVVRLIKRYFVSVSQLPTKSVVK